MLIEMVLGAALGYLVAEDLLLNTARTELRDYSANLVVHADTLVKEATDVLSAVSKSPHPFCSEADVAFMQGIIFEARFLKDVGRLNGNAFVCTALLNRIPVPVPIDASPLAVTGHHFRIYRNMRNLIGQSLASVMLSGNVGVVVDDGAFFNPPEFPMRYSTYIVNPQTRSATLIYGNSLSVRPDDILDQREGKRKGTLYSVRCSKSYSTCEMASVQVDDVLSGHRNVLIAFAVLGSFFGIAIAVIGILFMRRQGTLDKQLRRAVRHEQLYLLYQPIVELPGNRIVGAEALVRWKTIAGEQIPPDVFIPVAERGGYIGEITQLVLQRTASELGPLLRQHPQLHISINFSAPDLIDRDVLQALDRCVGAFALRPANLAIELTERITSDRGVAHKAISELRARGHRVYIDDFGTGYSSLAYLNDLNVDGVKLDRAFTSTIGTEAVTAVIVPQILKMADLLNLDVVVEGVETEVQVDYFSNSGRPRMAQGWYFSKPVPAEEIIRRVNAASLSAAQLPSAQD